MISDEIIFKLILHSGNGRSFAMEAIGLAKESDFKGAREKLTLAGEEIICAHQTQTELIQDEIRGNRSEISLLMVHAQDHLMNAISIKELSEEFVDLYEKIGGVIKREKINQ